MDAIRAELAAEQHVVDDLLIHLAHDVGRAARESALATWCELERRILWLMDAEEQLLLPLVEPAHHQAAQRSRDEHQHIRGLVCEMGVSIELRKLQIPAIHELRRALACHSQRESDALYRFCPERASAAAQQRSAAALRATAHSAHESGLKAAANRSGNHVARHA
jgi:hypothetical protein